MKVIDLLNKIANGEEIPLKIKVKGYEYRQSNGQFWCDETKNYLIDNCTSIYCLNDEVEIIEEDKKIKTIDCWYSMEDIKNNPELYNIMFVELKDKINEIIDYLDKGE